MIKKEITLHDGRQYTVGFNEVGSNKDGLECHILKKTLFGYKTIYKRSLLKGLAPDYKQIALFTILDYKRECEQKEQLLSESWN